MGESGGEYNYFRSFLGAVLALASIVFRRLDRRNARLVKISEDALKKTRGAHGDPVGVAMTDPLTSGACARCSVHA